ncbi:response regulator [Catenovulum sp. SM1970]|uniref:response regulator n=1 Tax=Marinifaba aquimaris TaxID=2741323 RepID=UPI001572F69E|nr:response regulator [Marinifaba aquimaris]NTS75289.1 response regulator [Marinifaba aquimaris]
MDKQDLAHYPSLNVLIIDDQTLVHNTIKSALFELGVNNIKTAENAYYALRLCQQMPFHIVICAFNVQSDKDGFHLLEEMKFKGYVTKRTVLIFLSADTAETLVNSIVELQPDDFWVKPLSPKQVQDRLAATLEIKQKLFDVYTAVDTKAYGKAIYYAERHLLDKEMVKFHLHLQRMKGESFLAIAEYQEAEAFFTKLLESNKLSWAYLGYAKALMKQDKMDEIQDLLLELQDKPDTRFATYDLLAQYHIDQEEYEQAYDLMQKAAKLSPRNIERNKKIWDLARLTHDHEGQFKATQAMAKYARNSIHDSPELMLNVIRSGIDFASTLNGEQSNKVAKQVESYIQHVESSSQDIVELKEQVIVAKARLHNVREEQALAERLVETHLTLKASSSLEDNLDKVKVFHELGKKEDALALLEAIKNQIVGDNLTSHVVSRYIEQEMDHRMTIPFTAKQLNSMAAEHYKKNRFDSALTTLNQALALTPKNIRVMLNILKVLSSIDAGEGLSVDQKALTQDMFSLLEGVDLSPQQQQILDELASKIPAVTE